MEKMTTFVTLASLVMVCEFSWRKAGNSGVLRAKLHEAPHADGVLCYPSAGQGHWFCTNTALQCCILAHLIACCSQNMLFLIKRKEKKEFIFSVPRTQILPLSTKPFLHNRKCRDVISPSSDRTHFDFVLMWSSSCIFNTSGTYVMLPTIVCYLATSPWSPSSISSVFLLPGKA